MAATVIAAQSMDPSAFGLLSLYLMAHGVMAAFARAIGSDLLQLHAGRYPVLSADVVADEIVRLRRLGRQMGFLLAVIFAFPAWRSVGWWAIVPTIALIHSLWLDSARNIFIALSRFKSAFAWDSIVLVLVVAVFRLVGGYDAGWICFVAAWALIQSVTGVIGQRLVSSAVAALPSPRQPSVDLTGARSFGTEYFMGVLALQAPLLTATWLVGPVAAAALRGADTFVAPLRILLTASVPLSLRKMASLSGARSQIREIAKYSGPLVLLALIWTIAILSLPSSVGRHVLGESWPHARAVAPLILPGFFAIIVTTFAATALKASGRGPYLVRVRLISAALSLALGVSGAALFGERGVAASMLVVSLISMVLWTVGVMRGSKAMTRGGGAGNE